MFALGRRPEKQSALDVFTSMVSSGKRSASTILCSDLPLAHVDIIMIIGCLRVGALQVLCCPFLALIRCGPYLDEDRPNVELLGTVEKLRPVES